MAERAKLFPGFGAFEGLRPERERAALARPRRVDAAAVLPKDAVAVRLQLKDRGTILVLGQITRFESSRVEIERTLETLDLGRAHIDPTRLSAAAAVIALAAGKA